MTPIFMVISGFAANLAISIILWLHLGPFAGAIWSGVSFALGAVAVIATGYYDERSRQWDTTQRK